jgi:hypothetical protein
MRQDETRPSGKRLKRGEIIKFKHLLFKSGFEARAKMIKRKTCPKQDTRVKKRVTEMRRKVAKIHNYNYMLKKQLKTMAISIIVGDNWPKFGNRPSN